MSAAPTQATLDRWPAADGCGAAGCWASANLERVHVDGRGQLVLCRGHAREVDGR